MKILDLFCCCGGMSRGFVDAGHEVVGVDITDDHQYPYEFIHSDVFKLEPQFFNEYDLIHASPPCQHYSYGTRQWRNIGRIYSDLVDKTRQLLLKTGKKFIIENVVGAPVRKDLVLCGEMFGLRVIRHRLFELNGFTVLQPPHIKHRSVITRPRYANVYGSGGDRSYSYYATVAGHGGNGFSTVLKFWQDSMGIDWITKKKHLAQAIPPKYAEYIINAF